MSTKERNEHKGVCNDDVIDICIGRDDAPVIVRRLGAGVGCEFAGRVDSLASRGYGHEPSMQQRLRRQRPFLVEGHDHALRQPIRKTAAGQRRAGE